MVERGEVGVTGRVDCDGNGRGMGGWGGGTG